MGWPSKASSLGSPTDSTECLGTQARHRPSAPSLDGTAGLGDAVYQELMSVLWKGTKALELSLLSGVGRGVLLVHFTGLHGQNGGGGHAPSLASSEAY